MVGGSEARQDENGIIMVFVNGNENSSTCPILGLGQVWKIVI